jgi:hypothetical protein
MNVTEHIREHLLSRFGLTSKEPRRLAGTYSIDSLRRTEWDSEFEKRMRGALLFGAIRYGRLDDSDKSKYRYVQDAIRRLKLYDETGNRHMLVDVANMCLLEFHNDDHPKSHLDDSGEYGHTETKE